MMVMITMMKGWFRVEFNDLWCASKRAWRLELGESQPAEGIRSMPSAGRVPAGTFSQRMGFISFQALGVEDELFLSIY